MVIASAVSAQQVHTYVDRDSVQVGDIFELTIIVQGNYSGLSFPNQDAFDSDEIEMISRERYQTAANRDSLVFQLQFFGTEDYTLPPLEITLSENNSDTTLTTSRVPLFFKTVLAGDDEEFRPLKPIFDFAGAVWPWVIAILLLLIALWLIYRYISRREPKRKVEVRVRTPIPFSDPLNELRREIEALPQAESLSGLEQYEEYYIRLGDAIRRYLKRVYRFPALEMTTREITTEMQTEMVSTETIRITRSVLNEADMVKFANFRPESSQAREALEKADRFIESAEKNDRARIERLQKQHEEAEAQAAAAMMIGSEHEMTKADTETETERSDNDKLG